MNTPADPPPVKALDPTETVILKSQFTQIDETHFLSYL